MTDFEDSTKQLINDLSRVIENTAQESDYRELSKAIMVMQAAAAVGAIAILTRWDIEERTTPREQFESFCNEVEEYMTFMMLEQANE